MFCFHLYSLKKTEKKIIKEFCNSEDIQFNWLIVSADFDKEDQDVHSELLK